MGEDVGREWMGECGWENIRENRPLCPRTAGFLETNLNKGTVYEWKW